MPVIDDVNAYEAWLRTCVVVVEEGLREKHARMAKNPFKFLRATCFRFARTLPGYLPHLASAPKVPSVGDAHIENWGTWRDAEGRLVWGVNDFDDAALLPYPYDLVRLATSARLASGLAGSPKDRADWILTGYLRGLESPKPWILDGAQPWMQALLGRPMSRLGIADDAANAVVAAADLPREILAVLTAQLPPGTSDLVFMTRQRGGGSLGRPRYLVEGRWRGGPVCREAKALVPSAWDWASGLPGTAGQSLMLAEGRFRSPDPFLRLTSGYMIRRIAYDSEKIDLTDGGTAAFGAEVLAAMGSDLAAIHLSGAVDPVALRTDVMGCKKDWLVEASARATDEVNSDFEEWQGYWRQGSGLIEAQSQKMTVAERKTFGHRS